MSLFGSTGKVTLKHYNYDTKQEVVDGEVGLWSLAKVLSIGDMAYLLDNWANGGCGQNGFRAGVDLGRMFKETHRTLQGVLANLALGILCGLGETDPRWTDARNETAIRSANKVKTLVDDGDLPLQRFI